jgi:hypothetical protein
MIPEQIDRRPEQGPCFCSSAIDPMHGDGHTLHEHDRGCCRGHLSTGDLCGGCYDCLEMQARHGSYYGPNGELPPVPTAEDWVAMEKANEEAWATLERRSS